MNIAIVGSRGYADPVAVREFVRSAPEGTVIVSGHCPNSPDWWAEEEARKRGLDCMIFPADWKKYGKSAGFKRNKDIVVAADLVVAFWDGASRGTQNTIKLARDAGKEVMVISPSI